MLTCGCYWLLHSTNQQAIGFLVAFKTGSLSSPASVSKFFSGDMFKLGAIFTKNSLKISGIPKSSDTASPIIMGVSPFADIFLFSVNPICYLVLIFLGKKRLYCFPKDFPICHISYNYITKISFLYLSY